VIGRYVVLDKLGSGGMGVVFAAYDPELDRKVAIKLLMLPEDANDGLSAGRSRLLREAQALAKLSHPNVVAIHDVGTMEERVWLAMEFIEGRTLSEWLAVKERGWREIRSVLLEAGRGLAAAHAKGMLHRDFKPENVMVGNDGRVRVMDFGLARANEDLGDQGSSLLYESAVRDATAAASLDVATTPGALLAGQVTHAGTLLGTPAYLAPEVFRGDGWGPAADQFAFCVTLWEALFAERPFEGDSLVELAAHVMEGTMRPTPRGRQVPTWLRKVCARGLRVEPEQRFASMEFLLSELQHDRGRSRRRAGAVAVIATLTLGAVGWRNLTEVRAHQSCLGESDAIDEVWNANVAKQLREQLNEEQSDYARDTADRVGSALDRYASSWRTARVESCDREDTATASSRPRVVECFDIRLDALSTLVQLLGRGETEHLRHAVVASVELPSARDCLDPLPASTDPKIEPRAHAEITTSIITAKVLLKAGQLEEAQGQASRALELAGQRGARELEAQARQLLGLLAQASSDFAGAEASLRLSYFDAFELDRHDIAAQSAIALTHLHAVGRVQFELGDLWLELARGLVDKLPEGELRLRAELAGAAAALATERANYDEAEVELRRSISLLEEGYGPAHPDIGLMYGHLAELFDDAGDFDAAEKAAKRGLELLDASLGPAHPDNAQALFALATAAWKRGRGREALELSELVLQLRSEAFGPDDVAVAEALNSVGNAHIQLGDWREADLAHGRALEIRKAKYGSDEPRVATSLVNLADVAVHAGRHDEGIAYARDSLRIWENKLGREHAYCAYAHIVIGEGQLREERFSQALAAFDRGLTIRAAGKESEHQLAEPLTGRGEALLGLGRVDEALVDLERAWSIRLRHPSDELHAPDTAFALARALWIHGEDRPRALELATTAHQQFAKVAAARPEGVAAVEAWQAERR
jgi:serine/threonine protein kinase/tetratricopeptide (TPR) repeat protein